MKCVVKVVVYAGVIVLAACGVAETRPPSPASDMAAWVGKPVEGLIASKGQPTKTTPLAGGAKQLEYTRERVVQRPGAPNVVMVPVNVSGGVPILVPQTFVEPPSTFRFSCTVLVRTSSAGLVESWKAEGNDC